MVVPSQKHRTFLVPLSIVVLLSYCSSYYFRSIGLALIGTGLLLIVPTIRLSRMSSLSLSMAVLCLSLAVGEFVAPLFHTIENEQEYVVDADHPTTYWKPSHEL